MLQKRSLSLNQERNRYDIGQRIRSFRLSRDLTQAELAESLDVSTNYISEIENGKKGMSQDTLCRLCLTYHLSADFLLFGKCEKDVSKQSLFESLSSIPADTIPVVIEYLEASLKIKKLEKNSI
ncbi:XRE family transcriptional regulator [Clostridiaceae bacterium]|nr:XRE family transcriptional regulator [Clostridiaceae bacterium]NBH35864.1 XRE family transcriptional regulator [Clostridiaceae bacterium]